MALFTKTHKEATSAPNGEFPAPQVDAHGHAVGQSSAECMRSSAPVQPVATSCSCLAAFNKARASISRGGAVVCDVRV